jgi:hypothetical protein
VISILVGWLVGSLFNDASLVTGLYSVNDRVISNDDKLDNLVGSNRGLILRYYPGIPLEGLSKTLKTPESG